MKPGAGASLATLLPAVAAGVVICMGLAVAVGIGPVDLVVTIVTGAWGSYDAAINTLARMTPLLLTGLAVALAYKIGLLNVGCEGQLTLGALVCATLGRFGSSLPSFVLLPVILAAGAAAGGLWAYPAVVLRQRRGVHEVITTLLLNYIALYLCGYLVDGPLGDGSAMGRTPPISPGAEMPVLLQSGSLSITPAPIFALLLCFAAYLWLSRTVRGFEVRSVGANHEAALNAGIAAPAWERRIFVLSGAIAGLAGAVEIASVHHRFYRAFSPGYGFDGLTAAFLANGSPEWLWISALFLASLRAADKWLQISLNISPNFIWIVQALLLLSVACQGRIRYLFERILSRNRN